MLVRTLAVLASATLVLTTTSCSGDEEAPDEPLVIGVGGSSPGWSMVDSDGGFSGFEIDLATYVAQGLGRDPRQVRFEVVDPGAREQALVDGSVDLVVSSYAITDAGSERVSVAGPYFTAGQDLLVRRSSKVTGPASLDGKTVCVVEGAGTGDEITAPDRSPGAELEEAADLTSCVVLLNSKTVDAVSADDVVLAGFAQRRGGKLKVVGSPFTEVSYGIGLPQDSPDVDAVDRLLRQAVDDGSWQRWFDEHLGDSGYTPLPPPTPGT